MTLHPAPDRIILELIEQRQESAQGIVMSNRSSGESPKGRVVEIGYDARSRLEGLQQGDTLFFAAGRGEIIADAGSSRIIVHVGDVLAWANSQ
ncbi:co-chaperone GroES [Marinobacter confluentis]|uniref:10 kDa chaperonin n=1 Tax=Marinobacter confluentis TaxID=1697557 RepID=A0A4Z1C702_9GAMM|nr:co-chaperone GroES [Marinobacter confluentis]TGN39145.1 hypothetical protein E5Q11_10845 [Marinobacter confluentis]